MSDDSEKKEGLQIPKELTDTLANLGRGLDALAESHKSMAERIEMLGTSRQQQIKVDFFVEGVLGFESGLIIESKWQDIGGSVDQKLVFLAMNIIERYTFPTIIVCGGKGAASGIIDRIKSKIDNRKLIAVFSFEEFLSWAIRNL